MVFTSLPVIMLGIFDQDIPSRYLMKFPQLYSLGLKRRLYTTTRFWMYMLDALYQSAVCFVIPYFVFGSASVSVFGYDTDLFQFGATAAICAITNANLYVAMNIHRWTWMHHLAIWGICLRFSFTTWF